MTKVEMMQTMFNQLADQWKVPRFNVTSGAVGVDDGLPDDFFDGDEEHEQPNDGGGFTSVTDGEFRIDVDNERVVSLGAGITGFGKLEFKDWHDNPLIKAVIENINNELAGKPMREYNASMASDIAKSTIDKFIQDGTITQEQVDKAEYIRLDLYPFALASYIEVPFIDPWPEKTVLTSIIENVAKAALDAGILVSGGCADGDNINTLNYWVNVENGRFDVTVDKDWHDRIMAEFHSNTTEALCGHLQDIPGVKEASVFADIDEPFVVEITVKCDEIANKRVIAESIYGHLPAGVATKGDISEIVAVPNGKWHDIRFNMTTEWSGGCGGSCESGGCADGGDCCSDEDESWLEDDGNSVLRCPQDCGNYKMLADYCNRGDRVVSMGRTVIDRNPCCRFRRR